MPKNREYGGLPRVLPFHLNSFSFSCKGNHPHPNQIAGYVVVQDQRPFQTELTQGSGLHGDKAASGWKSVTLACFPTYSMANISCFWVFKNPCRQAFIWTVLSRQCITFPSLLMSTRSSFPQQILFLFADRPAEALNVILCFPSWLFKHFKIPIGRTQWQISNITSYSPLRIKFTFATRVTSTSCCATHSFLCVCNSFLKFLLHEAI